MFRVWKFYLSLESSLGSWIYCENYHFSWRGWFADILFSWSFSLTKQFLILIPLLLTFENSKFHWLVTPCTTLLQNAIDIIKNVTSILLKHATICYYKTRLSFYYTIPSFIRKCNSHYKIQQIYFQMQKLSNATYIIECIDTNFW